MKSATSLVFSISCMLAASLCAQDPKVSLRTMQLGGDEINGLYVKMADAREPALMTWLSTQPGEPIQVSHDGSLKLYKQAADPAGKPVFEIAADIKLPVGEKEILLLAWESDGKIKYVAIRDQFLNAEFNDWMAINTSKNPVAILAGNDDKPIRVDAGSSVIFQPKIEEGKGVKVLAQAAREGEVKPFLSSYWPAFKGQRTMIIFYDDGEKMRAKRIGDRFLKKEEEPE